jgi:hypothetical protein
MISEFSAAEIRDVRVGRTSLFTVNYTTLFIGIAAGGTIFDLPIRINGPYETSMFPADSGGAAELASGMVHEWSRSPAGT